MSTTIGKASLPMLDMAAQPSVPEAARLPSDRAEIKRVAEEFESLFLNLVMKSMRDTVQKSGLIDGGNAESIYEGMLDTEYTKQMAAQRSTGLADSIEEFLLRSLEGRDEQAMQQFTEKLKAAQGAKAYKGAQPPNR